MGPLDHLLLPELRKPVARETMHEWVQYERRNARCARDYELLKDEHEQPRQP